MNNSVASRSNRYISLDIMRCCAFFFVVSVHFFLNIDYYNTPIIGIRMYLMTLARTFFMICVPLFMLLSGYLLSNKKVEKSHYPKLFKTLILYLISAIICELYAYITAVKSFSVFDLFVELFSFKAAPYGWYVEMYIGLFLLCPFLNVLYHNLNSKKQKLILLGTLVFLTALPSVTNIFAIDLDWFTSPSDFSDGIQIVPDYWTALYPLTYYFLGCYLKEYPIKMKTANLLWINLALFFINGSFIFYRNYGGEFHSNALQDHKSLLVLIQTVAFFGLIQSIDFSKITGKAARFINSIAELTFSAYLVSWIFDNYIYQLLNNAISDMPLRANYFMIVVPLIIILSLLTAWGVNWIYKLFDFTLNKSKSIILKSHHKI